MARTPQRIFVKPAMIDRGRGPQPALLPIPGTQKVLPPEGMQITLEGTNGSWWRRRISEGVVEVVEQKQAVKHDAKKGQE